MNGPFKEHHAGCRLATIPGHNCVKVRPGGVPDDGCACPECVRAAGILLERLYRPVPAPRRRVVTTLPVLVPGPSMVQ